MVENGYVQYEIKILNEKYITGIYTGKLNAVNVLIIDRETKEYNLSKVGSNLSNKESDTKFHTSVQNGVCIEKDGVL